MFSQHAKGDFTTEVTGLWHCGPNHDSPKHFQFEVQIQYRSGAVLTPEGFLLDNTDFQSYFDGIQTTALSCEYLAQQACEHFCGMVAGNGKHVRVTIWGIVGKVCITCEKRLTTKRRVR